MQVTKKYTTTAKQKGLALISIVLFTALVLASIVGITATMAMTAKRTTTDQMMALRAQYAAESGLSLAKLRLGELEDVVNLAKFPTTLLTLDNYALDFCGLVTYSNPPKPTSDWNNTQLINGFEVCGANPLGGSSSTLNRLSILSDHISKFDMEQIGITIPPEQYWEELFSSTITSTQILQANSEGTVRFEIDYNMKPKAVRLLQDGLSMRFVFSLGNVVAKGTIEDPAGKVIAARKLELQPNATELYLEVSKPSFAQYGYFADTRRAPNGAQIYFKDGNYIGGRVHINNDVAFSASTTTGGPRFSGKFSTTEPAVVWGSGSQIVNEELMFLGGSEFGAQLIELPVNNHIQRDKALGLDGITTTDEICGALKLAIDSTPAGCQATASGTVLEDGIYYAFGDGADTSNILKSALATLIDIRSGRDVAQFLGGIYIQGDVDDIILDSDADAKQGITIKHRNGREVSFRQYQDIGWAITDTDNQSGALLGISDNFNGLIYVDGKIGCDDRRGNSVSNYSGDSRASINPLYADGNPMCSSADDGLKGDGTDAPDLETDFMITVTATGNVNIKDDITYEFLSQCATQPEDTFNILGVFTPDGNIKVDGIYGKDLTIHGAFMASKIDHGFGTNEFATYKRGNDVNIVLHGSVVHHTDQAVGTFSAATGQNITGYGRKWTFDCRLGNGFAPPFFPTQTEWDKLTSFNGLNNRSTWRLR